MGAKLYLAAAPRVVRYLVRDSQQSLYISPEIFTFRPRQRLLEKSQFQSIFNSINLRVELGAILILANINSLNHSRLGVAAPKKNLKRAVDRNRVKRLFREAFRTHQHLLIVEINNKPTAMDIVLLSRKGLAELSNCAIHQKLNEGFIKLQRISKKKYSLNYIKV